MRQTYEQTTLKPIRVNRLIAAMLIVSVCGWDECLAAEGRTLVVAQLHPAASDDNPGTAEQPFKSISRAAREAQAGDLVGIEDGVYRESVLVEQSGSKERPIVFAAVPGANVVVTGTDVVTQWQREPGDANIFSAPWPLFGTGCVARRCVFRDNGQLGFNATAADLLITECLCENNNVKNFSREWEAGGNKLVLCKNAVIERSTFRDNHGNGIWFDIGNEDCTVRNCLIADNDDAGIFYAISYRLHAHDNVIVRNGFAPRHRAWGANGGISLSSSAGCQIERNLLVGNKEGLQFRDQVRVTNRIGRGGESFAIWNRDHRVNHNLLAWNRDIQTGGWFDLAEQSHWRLADVPSAKPPAAAEQDELRQRPAGLTLSNLRFDLHDNLYAAKPGQVLVQWGCHWHRHEKLSVEEVQQKLGLESGSRNASPEFANWTTLDLRLPASSPIVTEKCYPQGQVPGVLLGTVP